jgi:hypothetical protein
MRGILDVVYWKLHAAFLLNDRGSASRYLAMLEDEARARGRGALAREIGPVHMLRCRRIAAEVRSGSFRRLHGDGVSTPSVPFQYDTKEKTEDEKAFQRRLYSHSGGKVVFLAAIGAPADAVIVPELDLREFGRCDLVLYGGRRAWVVELKMGEARSSAVSQIDKYRLALELDMGLGLYDEVSAVVIAASFPRYVAGELSRMGVGMVVHDGNPESLRTVA